MTIFLDLAGSFVVRASMVTIMLGLTVTMNNALYNSTQQANTKATVATVSSIIYEDVNEAIASGITVSEPMRMRITADTSLGLGKLATITYDMTEVDATTGLHKLYRDVDGHRVLIAYNIDSKSTFEYYDVDGHLTSSAGSVDAIRVKLVAQVAGVTEGFTTALSDFKAFPANLN